MTAAATVAHQAVEEAHQADLLSSNRADAPGLLNPESFMQEALSEVDRASCITVQCISLGQVIDLMQRPGWLKSRQPAVQPEVLQMANITRHTLIATRVEIAGGPAARSRGLLGRRSLAPGEGLWITPCEAVHTWGMKFAIDLVYLDRHYRVKKIRKNVVPWRFSACFTAHSVVELAACSVRDGDLQPGDVVEFSPSNSAATTS